MSASTAASPSHSTSALRLAGATSTTASVLRRTWETLSVPTVVSLGLKAAEERRMSRSMWPD